MSVAHPKSETIPTTLPDSCPVCHSEIAVRLQLALASIRAAVEGPMTLELLIPCKECLRPFVVSLHPVPDSMQ